MSGYTIKHSLLTDSGSFFTPFSPLPSVHFPQDFCEQIRNKLSDLLSLPEQLWLRNVFRKVQLLHYSWCELEGNLTLILSTSSLASLFSDVKFSSSLPIEENACIPCTLRKFRQLVLHGRVLMD